MFHRIVIRIVVWLVSWVGYFGLDGEMFLVEGHHGIWILFNRSKVTPSERILERDYQVFFVVKKNRAITKCDLPPPPALGRNLYFVSKRTHERTDTRTDGQVDSSISPKTFVLRGINRVSVFKLPFWRY